MPGIPALVLAISVVVLAAVALALAWRGSREPKRGRAVWAIVAAVGAAAFLYAAEDVVEGDDLAALDEPLTRSARALAPPALLRWMEGVSVVGSAAVVVPVVAALVLVAWREGHGDGARRFVLAMALQAALAGLLKLAFARARPDLALVPAVGSSFPSGHTSAAAALAVAAAYALSREKRPAKALVALALVGLVWTTLMAASRVTLGVHYPSDVLGGAGVGALVAGAVYAMPRRAFAAGSAALRQERGRLGSSREK